MTAVTPPMQEPSKASPERAEAFSTTAYTMLGQWLDAGDDEGLGLANHHLMSVYAQPLRSYLLGSTFRSLGDPDDIVRGFFADRLSRPEFLREWLQSRRRLRHWLITAFRHYLLEESRRQASRRRHESPAVDGQHDAISHSAREGTPEKTFYREVARGLVQQAMRLTAESCEASGCLEHWDVLIQHRLHGRTYEELAQFLDQDAARLRVMARTAENRFRRQLRRLVAWPGARKEEIDQEICALLEIWQ